MVPMVFSATAVRMPAFAASRPISSSIFARPHPVSAPGPSHDYLELPGSELQATTAFAGPIQLRSHRECCSNASSASQIRSKMTRQGHHLQLSSCFFCDPLSTNPDSHPRLECADQF